MDDWPVNFDRKQGNTGEHRAAGSPLRRAVSEPI
jgi:hypothetical protein